MTPRIASFHAADYLDNEETIGEFLTASLEDPNPEVFLMALRDVAKARGIAKVAKTSGLGRESLYKALAPGSKPRFETIVKVLRGLGVDLQAHAAHPAELDAADPAPLPKEPSAGRKGRPASGKRKENRADEARQEGPERAKVD